MVSDQYRHLEVLDESNLLSKELYILSVGFPIFRWKNMLAILPQTSLHRGNKVAQRSVENYMSFFNVELSCFEMKEHAP